MALLIDWILSSMDWWMENTTLFEYLQKMTWVSAEDLLILLNPSVPKSQQVNNYFLYETSINQSYKLLFEECPFLSSLNFEIIEVILKKSKISLQGFVLTGLMYFLFDTIDVCSLFLSSVSFLYEFCNRVKYFQNTS